MIEQKLPFQFVLDMLFDHYVSRRSLARWVAPGFVDPGLLLALGIPEPARLFLALWIGIAPGFVDPGARRVAPGLSCLIAQRQCLPLGPVSSAGKKKEFFFLSLFFSVELQYFLGPTKLKVSAIKVTVVQQ